MKPSQHHPNRKAYNTILYDINDDFLRKFIPLYKGHLYDLGCGEMPYKSWLLNYAEEYTGIDWGNTLHNLKADILADLNKPLPVESDVADTVISLSVMEHLREPQLFVNEAYRILKPGGTMILQVPFMWGIHEAPYDYFRYTSFGLHHLYKHAGFKDIKVYPQTGFWVTSTLKFNYQSRRLIRGPKLIKSFIGVVLKMVWTFNQPLARWLDGRWHCDNETAGYFVVGKKHVVQKEQHENL